jgi:hypothetical protein
VKNFNFYRIRRTDLFYEIINVDFRIRENNPNVTPHVFSTVYSLVLHSFLALFVAMCANPVCLSLYLTQRVIVNCK